ncbi:MAG TPA: hypothetical protein VJ063_07395 [Verrucomicrobiae bacterium]|nr:hypothetical protein [Verrucomicrobiae bacterium]
MARLIDSRTAVEIDQVVGGLPVFEFIEETATETQMLTVPRKTGAARLDRSFEVMDWLEC